MTAAGDLTVEVAVVGAGLMGAATAWQLSRQGHSVALIEQFEPGHKHGSSHGTSRIFRHAYPDAFYIRLTGRARESWREASEDVGEELLTVTGGVDSGEERKVADLAALLAAAGIPHELLDQQEAASRWPAFAFDTDVLFHPGAGVINADASVAAFVRRTSQVLSGTCVTGIREHAAGVEVSTDRGEVLAETVVVAAGAWLPTIGIVTPEVSVTQQSVFHFPVRAECTWPTFIHAAGGIEVYGLPSGADAPGCVKAAQHNPGLPVTATARDGSVDPSQREFMSEFARRYLPGLDPEPRAETTCLYTSTADADFVLDRVGRVVIVSACSGHGAKFAPLIGELAADLALGRSEPLARFALGRSA